MDAFELLCRRSAGVGKDRSKSKSNLKFRSDVNALNGVRFSAEVTGKRLDGRGENQKEETDTSGPPTTQLPPELDFFKAKEKVAEASNEGTKRKTRDANEDNVKAKKRKTSPKQEENSVKITAEGSRIPASADSFNDLDLPEYLLEHLNDSSPTPLQRHVLPILLQGRDLLCTAPPSSGKTLSFILPTLSRLAHPIADPPNTDNNNRPSGIRALILTSTRERARLIHSEFHRLSEGRKWKCVLLNKENEHELGDSSVREATDVVVSTPHRFHQTLKSGPVSLKSVRHLVLDDANMLFGNEFLSQTQDIMKACSRKTLQKAVFSATLSASTEKLAMDLLKDPVRVFTGERETPLAVISQTLTYVADNASKIPSLTAYLARPYNPPVLIFVSSQARASALEQQLMINDVKNISCLRPSMTEEQKDEAVKSLGRGECWIMICTDATAEGVEFKGVRTVINVDFPTSAELYTKRIGWTGRGGLQGTAVTYYTNDDLPYLRPIVKILDQSGSVVPDWLKKLPEQSAKKVRELKHGRALGGRMPGQRRERGGKEAGKGSRSGQAKKDGRKARAGKGQAVTERQAASENEGGESDGSAG